MQPERSSLLLGDDDPASRALLRRYLTQHGFDVAEAAGRAEALALVGRHSFDLVLLDVEMPGTNGLEVLRAIRARHTAADLPVMMATVRDCATDIVGALTDGANDYVTKPFDLPVVLARVRTQCSLRQAVEHLARATYRMRREPGAGGGGARAGGAVAQGRAAAARRPAGLALPAVRGAGRRPARPGGAAGPPRLPLRLRRGRSRGQGGASGGDDQPGAGAAFGR